jgi:hypothetical protein
VGEHETMGLDERIVGRVERLEVELFVVSSVVAGSRTAADSLFADWRGLVAAYQRWLASTRRPLPSRNALVQVLNSAVRSQGVGQGTGAVKQRLRGLCTVEGAQGGNGESPWVWTASLVT